ncbi:MAG: hypothetical protein ACI4SR_08175 [Faecalibacillus sp.]
MKNTFRKYYNDIHASEHLITEITKKEHFKRNNHFNFILVCCLIVFVIGSFHLISYHHQSDNFTIYALEDDNKKAEITDSFTQSKGQIKIIDISQMNNKEVETLIRKVQDENNSFSYSSQYSYYAQNDQFLIYFSYFTNFSFDINNSNHIKNIIISKENYDTGVVCYSTKDKSIYTVDSTHYVLPYNAPEQSSVLKQIEISKEEYLHQDHNHMMILWYPSEGTIQSLLEDPHYINHIQDSIIFTVNYDNGKKVQKKLMISFDKEGHMKLKAY